MRIVWRAPASRVARARARCVAGVFSVGRRALRERRACLAERRSLAALGEAGAVVESWERIFWRACSGEDMVAEEGLMVGAMVVVVVFWGEACS